MWISRSKLNQLIKAARAEERVQVIKERNKSVYEAYHLGLLIGKVEKSDRALIAEAFHNADLAFAERLNQEADEMERRASLLNIPPAFSEWRDASEEE